MYTFTMDFNCNNGAYTNIVHLVNTYGIPNTIVEIGAYEGSTTFWVSDKLTPYNKNLTIYTIDPHVGATDLDSNFKTVHRNFMYNMNLCENKNIHYIQKDSSDGLIDLISQGVEAELIYIDGDHRAAGVLSDLVLAWQILKVGGVILCDDTTTWKYKDPVGTYTNQMSPRLAVETFIQCNWHKLNILVMPDGTQTAFIKTQK